MAPDAFAHLQAEARAAKAPASAQVGLDDIVQRARFSEAALILTIVTRCSAEPEEPGLPRRSYMLQAMALRLNDEARRKQWDTYSSSYSGI